MKSPYTVTIGFLFSYHVCQWRFQFRKKPSCIRKNATYIVYMYINIHCTYVCTSQSIRVYLLTLSSILYVLKLSNVLDQIIENTRIKVCQ